MHSLLQLMSSFQYLLSCDNFYRNEALDFGMQYSSQFWAVITLSEISEALDFKFMGCRLCQFYEVFNLKVVF